MRDVKISFSMGWKKSRIEKAKEPGYYCDCTVSLITEVPDEISDKDLVRRWDAVSITPPGVLRYRFHYYDLLDAETTATADYWCTEHNKLRL